MAREVAPAAQWKEKKGARYVRGRLIEHPDFSGFLTVADEGSVAGYFITDASHSGFVTPDDAASEGDADILIVGGGFAVVVD